MKLKEILLNQFAENPGIFLSGQVLAEANHVSRTAVWKAVNALRKDGFSIVTDAAKGYCFEEDNDVLNQQLILSASQLFDLPVYLFDEIDSTNTYARSIAAKVPHGTIVVADHQTAGRGRRGHSFFSPKSTGLYFTMIAHPSSQQYISRITPAAAVASLEAIQEVTGITCGIKWVNDLFLEKKKVAGILCEAISDLDSGEVTHVIIGIGINCTSSELPDDIKDTAGFLNAPHLSRARLAGILQRRLLYWLEHLDDPSLSKNYRQYSAVLNKEIAYQENNAVHTGFVKAINDDGNLLLIDEAGKEKWLTSGEISIKNW